MQRQARHSYISSRDSQQQAYSGGREVKDVSLLQSIVAINKEVLLHERPARAPTPSCRAVTAQKWESGQQNTLSSNVTPQVLANAAAGTQHDPYFAASPSACRNIRHDMQFETLLNKSLL